MRRSCIHFTAFILFLYFLVPFSVQAQLASKKSLTLEAAKKLASLAEAEALKNKWTMVIAIVDDGGNLMYLERMDNTQIGSIEVAIQKAKTAISFKRPTKVYEDLMAQGKTDILGIPGVIPIEGGLPLVVDGQYIGAIGVSGGTRQQDGLVAKAAVDAFSPQ
jgi:glc operon protein GlcG